MQKEQYGAGQIKVLSGLSAVRKRPAMYIGNTSIEGLHHLVYEVVDNSIDEALAGHCTAIEIIIHEDGSISVEDNGRGIPVDIHPTEGISALELVLTRLHAGGKFDHSTYKVSGGLHGVGISVVNALSSLFTAEVYRNGLIYRQSYRKGDPVGPMECLGETKKRGTKITFHPDPEIFQETTEFQFEILQARMRELAFLNPAVRIHISDERSGDSGNFHFSGGVVSFVEYLSRNKELVHDTPIFISGERDQVQAEIAFLYNTGYSERLLSYVNNIRTKEGGTHETGFRQALTKCINRYASDDIVPKKLREKMEGDDIREGLTAVISVRVPNPQFEGQTKAKLGNSEVRSIVSSLVYDALSTYLEENPQVAKRILAKVVDAARAREAARKAKDLARKTSSSQEMFMAGKLAECQERDPSKREIFIVEGDSAGGSAKQGRNRRFQAILPLRGKIMNVEKARYDKMLASEEIRNLIAALGTGIGAEDFDFTRVRYHKIIIMTDADVDGAHIRTLLLTFFYRQMFSLIENGMIYVAQPPLYRISHGKGKEMFLKDDRELDEFLIRRATANLSVRPHGWDRPLAGENLEKLLKDASTYHTTLEELGKKGLWRNICEDLLVEGLVREEDLLDLGFMEGLAEKIKQKGYRVGRIKPATGEHTGYEFDVGVEELAYLTATIGPSLFHMPEYRRAIKAFSRLDGLVQADMDITDNSGGTRTVSGIGELLSVIRNDGQKGISLQRYKGLGEMNPEQLWQTTMDPEKRTLMRVTIRDADDAESLFTTLMGDKIEPRREFIYTHALEVRELDI